MYGLVLGIGLLEMKLKRINKSIAFERIQTIISTKKVFICMMYLFISHFLSVQ